ncbi:MAG: lipid-A-disaccharide synthase [Ignavibacteriae bacterium]|nr:lipid-A-disaccharide synthase [Ignavibacteriota bacterium]
MNKKIMIIAGEASGDLHGAALIDELLKIDPQLEISGIGGDKMIKSGLKKIYHISEMSFLGFVEVIKHLPFIKKVKANLINHVQIEGIKTVVLIDYPGFNLSIAKSFYKLGVKNIYYISPQIWAWGKGRIKKIKKIINKMIVFFPFEKELYTSNNVHSDFVGHPLVNKIETFDFLSKKELVEKYNLDEEKDILVLLPGSRKQEISEIFKDIIDGAEKIANEFNLQIVIAGADNIEEEYIRSFSNSSNYKVIKGDTYSLLKNAKFAIVKSGTSTLETAIIGTPFLVVYKTSYLTYLIGKSLIKINNIALANIVAEKTIVKELIQNEVTANNIYKEAKNILGDQKKTEKLKNDLSEIKRKLKTEGNPNKKAAEIIYAELNAI